MKLSSREAPGYFARPDPAKAGILIYGEDTMRVALRRQELVAALIGPDGEAEMRFTRLSGPEVRKDPAQVLDALKAQGFFPGPRAVLVEAAADGVTKALTGALQDWQPGDAQLVVTAGALQARSSLRKLFEAHPAVYAVGLYNEPPSRAEVQSVLAKAGLQNLPEEALGAIEALARDLPPGDFRQTVEKLALYKLDDPAPLTVDEVTAMAPATTEAGVDDLLNAVAEGRAPEIGPLMQRLQAQGTAAVTLLIMATRHFRALHAAASHPQGAGSGIGRVRPPVFGPRRDRMVRQAQGWGVARLETAQKQLLDTDLTLRSAGQTAPAMALVERAFIRLAMMAR